MNVYVLFEAWGEGDSFATFFLVSLHSTKEGAMLAAKNLRDEKILVNHYTHLLHQEREETLLDLVHDDMSESNSFTVTATRADCADRCDYSCFGGFIVEEMEVEI